MCEFYAPLKCEDFKNSKKMWSNLRRKLKRRGLTFFMKIHPKLFPILIFYIIIIFSIINTNVATQFNFTTHCQVTYFNNRTRTKYMCFGYIHENEA